MCLSLWNTYFPANQRVRVLTVHCYTAIWQRYRATHSEQMVDASLNVAKPDPKGGRASIVCCFLGSEELLELPQSSDTQVVQQNRLDLLVDFN